MKIEIDGLIFDSKKLISVEKYNINKTGLGSINDSLAIVDKGTDYYLKLTLESSSGSYFNKTLCYKEENTRDEKYRKLYELIEKNEPIIKL